MGLVDTAMSRARYTAAQSARVAWYGAHYVLARRLSAPFDRPGEPTFRPKSQRGRPKPIRDAFMGVFAQDQANIARGLYPAPRDFSVAAAAQALAASQRFFEDLPKLDARRLARDGVEVRGQNHHDAERYPAYYLQNFHYQTDGWLSADSAHLYDMQVEVLFAGAADAMRRVALGVLCEAMRGHDQRRVKLVDVGCGSGRFLTQILSAFPRMNVVGVDLSQAYVDKARVTLAPWRQAEAVVGLAEALPFSDGALDAATCVYLFHELPPKVRRQVATDIARVLAPGGVLLFADSLQRGDHPDLDQMLEYFPVGFHEPFYNSYQQENLEHVFSEAGFDLECTHHAFLTKIMRFRRRA
jgi:ubiquinone/menaquinone biosynthesis C-methylase UbiE